MLLIIVHINPCYIIELFNLLAYLSISITLDGHLDLSFSTIVCILLSIDVNRMMCFSSSRFIHSTFNEQPPNPYTMVMIFPVLVVGVVIPKPARKTTLVKVVTNL